MVYNIKVYKGGDTEYHTLGKKGINKLTKDVKKKNYDGSYTMKNGDIIVIEDSNYNKVSLKLKLHQYH